MALLARRVGVRFARRPRRGDPVRHHDGELADVAGRVTFLERSCRPFGHGRGSCSSVAPRRHRREERERDLECLAAHVFSSSGDDLEIADAPASTFARLQAGRSTPIVYRPRGGARASRRPRSAASSKSRASHGTVLDGFPDEDPRSHGSVRVVRTTCGNVSAEGAGAIRGRVHTVDLGGVEREAWALHDERLLRGRRRPHRPPEGVHRPRSCRCRLRVPGAASRRTSGGRSASAWSFKPS